MSGSVLALVSGLLCMGRNVARILAKIPSTRIRRRVPVLCGAVGPGISRVSLLCVLLVLGGLLGIEMQLRVETVVALGRSSWLLILIVLLRLRRVLRRRLLRIALLLLRLMCRGVAMLRRISMLRRRRWIVGMVPGRRFSEGLRMLRMTVALRRHLTIRR